MNNKDCCCRNCSKRFVDVEKNITCHSYCDEYLEFVRKCEEHRVEEFKYAEENRIFHMFGAPGNAGIAVRKKKQLGFYTRGVK